MNGAGVFLRLLGSSAVNISRTIRQVMLRVADKLF